MEKQKLPNSTTILVLGILSVPGCCLYAGGLVLGIVALVLAKSATKLYNENPEQYDGIANVNTGKILAVIGIILSVLYIAGVIYLVALFGWDAFQDPELLREKIESMQ